MTAGNMFKLVEPLAPKPGFIKGSGTAERPHTRRVNAKEATPAGSAPTNPHLLLLNYVRSIGWSVEEDSVGNRGRTA